MVSGRRILRGRFVCRGTALLGGGIVALLLLGAALLPTAVRAAEAERIPMEVHETFTYTFIDTGDAHCEDVLEYDRTFFNRSGFMFEKYPWILSRRFRDPNLVGEIRNFNADVDMEKATITLTYDRIGRAYNEGDFWIMRRSQKPSFVREDEVVFEQENSVNNEFTLWETLTFKVTTHVKPPPSATSFGYDRAEKGVTWQTPGQLATLTGGGSLLVSHGALFLFIFIVMLLAGVGGLAALYLTGRRPVVSAVTVTVPAAPPLLGSARVPGDAQARVHAQPSAMLRMTR